MHSGPHSSARMSQDVGQSCKNSEDDCLSKSMNGLVKKLVKENSERMCQAWLQRSLHEEKQLFAYSLPVVCLASCHLSICESHHDLQLAFRGPPIKSGMLNLLHWVIVCADLLQT